MLIDLRGGTAVAGAGVTAGVTAAARPRMGVRMSTNDTSTVPPGLPEGAKILGEQIADAREWVGCLCIEGMQTSDHRFIAVDAIGWRPLPLTLSAQLRTAAGHDEAVVAGRIDRIEKMPVAAALYLLRVVAPPATFSPSRFLGLDLRRPGFDLGSGLLLSALIGIPGLGFYVAAKALGLNTQVAAANLGGAWWTVPVLVLAAVQNAVLEEVIVVGYLFTRLRQLGWQVPVVLVASAGLRGSYHLYQGFGGFVGNLVMGLVFGLVYLRWRRVGPLVVAHTVLDVVAFVGYTLARDHVSWLR